MSNGVWKVIGALVCLCMIGAATVSAIMGGCDTMLECTSGDMPMKCHWTFVAATLTSVIGIVSAVVSMFANTKEGRRIASLMTLVVCVITALLPTSLGIGLCGNSAMHCHQTAYIVWVLIAVAAVLSIVQLVKADPDEADKPKMTL